MPLSLSLFARRPWLALVPGLLLAASVRAAEPATPATMVPSKDGAFVIDLRARLAWPRCVEGMQWSGTTCTGTPKRMDYAEATALANARWKAEGVRWRLPRAPELKRLVDKTARPPGPNPALFPAGPHEWYWSGTANVQVGAGNQYNYGNVMDARSGGGRAGFLQGWAVNMETGESRGDVPRSTRLPVRLVRPHDE